MGDAAGLARELDALYDRARDDIKKGKVDHAIKSKTAAAIAAQQTASPRLAGAGADGKTVEEQMEADENA